MTYHTSAVLPVLMCTIKNVHKSYRKSCIQGPEYREICTWYIKSGVLSTRNERIAEEVELALQPNVSGQLAVPLVASMQFNNIQKGANKIFIF